MIYSVHNSTDDTVYVVDTDTSARACCLECGGVFVVEEPIGAIQSHPDPGRPFYLCRGGGLPYYVPDRLTFESDAVLVARAFVAGRYIGICYVNYQGHSNVTRADAERYLEWLDAGNVGKHHQAPRR